MNPARYRVLVVEDDADSAALLLIALSRKGLDVRSAASCAQARAACAEGDIDAIVVDLSLPDGSGYDLIQSLAPRPRVAIIVSGYDSDEDRERARALGCAAHMAKPVDISALTSILTESLAAAP